MNYNHPIEFGTSITPLNTSPENPVALARRSEELGFDLVTFQDHPYESTLIDAWTLIAWAAARTERVHLAPDALNVSLRSPAGLARSAAGLDLLSRGRLDLALGVGGSREAIQAMGGRRLSPDEAVDALGEAIDVIRGIFDVGDASPLRYEGNYFPLDGMERGPRPVHEIPVWLSGGEPRMLRLIGQKADGWLSSIGSQGAGEFAAQNKVIDEAAGEAGRDPAEIRRLVTISGQFSTKPGGFLDGPSTQWVDDLLPLAVENGVGTFILASADLHTMERFAHEVAPMLREAANRELPAPLSTAKIRKAAVRAKRRAGIDYDGVPASLADVAVEPGDVGYPRVRSARMRAGAPGLVLQVRSTAEVVDALAFARRHRHLPLGLRSGGHGFSGRSTNDGGIVIDLSRLNRVEVVDRSSRRVRIGAGALWRQVAAALDSYGWALGSGDFGGVGVGGLATAGGIGFLSRKYGLTIDHLRAAEMVLADGSVLRVSEEDNPDLFWAVRGAGANFGIVTSFEFEVDEVKEVGWAQLIFDAGDIAGFLQRFGEVASSAPRDTTAFVVIDSHGGQQPVPLMMVMVDSDNPDVVAERLRPLMQIAPLLQQQVSVTSYASVMALFADAHQEEVPGELISRSAFVEEVSPGFAAAASQMLANGATWFFQLRTLGGAIADVDPDAMAFSHRTAGFQVTALGTDSQRINGPWDAMRTYFDGLYLSFETDQRPERLADAFPPRTLARLRQLKLRYDPDNLFRDNFNIPTRP